MLYLCGGNTVLQRAVQLKWRKMRSMKHIVESLDDFGFKTSNLYIKCTWNEKSGLC